MKKTPDMLEFEYTRSALKNGLKLEAKLGVNPYKFGLVGSTDSHTGLSTADDDNFFGKISTRRAKPGTLVAPLHDEPQARAQDHGLGDRPRRVMPPSGRRRTHAPRFSTP